MCPLRFILVFFSALLAGYFAWKSIRADDEEDDILNFDELSHSQKQEKQQDTSFIQMVQNGFWVFVDMASGRYLWRNLKGGGGGDQPSSPVAAKVNTAADHLEY